jgi:hypothetical protein
MDFVSLRALLQGQTIRKLDGFKIIDTTANVSPFSFFNTIVYNSGLYSDSELSNILEHEKVHSSQVHSLDVLLARLYCIAFWFNPFVWIYKKAMLQNLEFIADSEAVKRISDVKTYQFTLLKITAHDGCVAITNQFYQSLIKKRIVMLNTNQSKKENSWKYALIIPVLAAFMFYCQTNVIAKEKQLPMGPFVMQSGVEIVVDKNTSDAEMKKDAELLKKQHNVTLKFSKVKRNNKGEIIAIKAEFKDPNGKKGITQISGEEPITPIRFYKDNNGVGFGRSARTSFVRRAVASDDDDDAHEITEITEIFDEDSTGGDANERRIIVRKSKDGKSTIVTMNGEVIVDTDKILAEMGPMIDAIDVRGLPDDLDVNIDVDAKRLTREAMRTAEQGLRRARVEMMNVGPEMEKAHREMEAMRSTDMEQARRDMEQAKRDLEQAKRDMEQAKRELEETRRSLEQQKK